MTSENDIVLIYYEGNPMAFARVEDISADVKPNWYHVTLLLLQVPVQLVTWILRDVYIDGEEFTMNGKKMRLEKVVAPKTGGEETGEDDEPADEPDNELDDELDNEPDSSRDATVISFRDFKKDE